MKKNMIKLIGIIALAAVIGFGMAACDNGNSGGTGNNGGGSGGLSGTYVHEMIGMASYLTFNGSNFTLMMFGVKAAEGTYGVSSSTITCNITYGEEAGTSKNLTLIDANTISDGKDETWIKQ